MDISTFRDRQDVKFSLVPMSRAEAQQIAAWRYDGEYALYNTPIESTAETVEAFLTPAYAYHSVWHEDHGLFGYCCYGEDAQVPGGDYDIAAVDIGLGMRPDLVGRGFGMAFLQAILNHAGRLFDSDESRRHLPYRATIATFNGRCRRIFQKAGFEQVQAFAVDAPANKSGKLGFVVVVRRTAANQTGVTNERTNRAAISTGN